jgi:hypothetical protein
MQPEEVVSPAPAAQLQVKNGESTKWIQWYEAMVVDGGFCITIGSLD